MAIQLDIKSELPQAIRFTNEHVKQLPFSVSQALNATAQGSKFLPGSKQKSVLNASRGVLSSQLDRPKEQTALRATVATKRNLQVTIPPRIVLTKPTHTSLETFKVATVLCVVGRQS